jgi:hAT family C-terminal dimerisation region
MLHARLREIPLSVISVRSSDKERAGHSITQPDDSKLDLFQKPHRNYQDKQLRPQSQDELKNFFAETSSYDIPKSSIRRCTDEVQQTRWPQLSLFAIGILSIAAMSDKPERIFSGGRRRVGWERASTGPELIERAGCMKDWKSQGILKIKF